MAGPLETRPFPRWVIVPLLIAADQTVSACVAVPNKLERPRVRPQRLCGRKCLDGDRIVARLTRYSFTDPGGMEG